MGLSLYNLHPIVYRLLPGMAALALAAIGYFSGMLLANRLSRRSDVGRVAHFSRQRAGDMDSKNVKAFAIGSHGHRVRLAFKSIGIDAQGNEEIYMWSTRLGVGVALMLVLLIIGLPLITALSGFLGGYVFVNGWVKRSWSKMKTAIEAEIPSLLTRLASALQIASNVPGAIEIVAKTLRQDGPLHAWAMDTASRMHADGRDSLTSIRTDAAEVSPSLSIVAELIGRMWQTGGDGYHAAFAAASENLESILDARVMARSKGAGAQRTVNTLVVLIVVMIGYLTRGDAMASVTSLPFVQAAYAVIILMVVYGHNVVSEMIENAV